MASRNNKRIVHWRWEYRLRYRPHVLLVAEEESLTPLRLKLQARWLCSVAKDADLALCLAGVLLPSRILVDASISNGVLLIERLKRDYDTHLLPILWLSRTESDRVRGCDAGASLGLVTSFIGFDSDIKPVQLALFDLIPSQSRRVNLEDK